MRQDSLTDNCRFRQTASSNWHRQSLQLQPSGWLSCGLLAPYLIYNSLLRADKAICKSCCKMGKNRKGNGTITHKARCHRQLFPKQHLNKHLTNWSSCTSQVKASGKCERERCVLRQLAKPGCYQRGHAVWILLPLVKWSFRNHAFFSWTGAVGFSTGSARWLRVRCRGVGAASSFWRGREKLCWIL